MEQDAVVGEDVVVGVDEEEDLGDHLPVQTHLTLSWMPTETRWVGCLLLHYFEHLKCTHIHDNDPYLHTGIFSLLTFLFVDGHCLGRPLTQRTAAVNSVHISWAGCHMLAVIC